MARLKRLWLVLSGCAFLALGAAQGCGGSDEEEIRSARLLEGCLINSDCAEPLVCVFRKCHKQCATSRDCELQERCVAGEDGVNVCQPEIACAYNSQCPGIQVCASDGKCRDQCAADRDCVAEQSCVSGVCAEQEELIDGGLPVVDAGPGNGRPCSYNSECDEPLACINGQCKIECYENRDCTYGLVCYLKRCSLPSAVPDASSGSGGASGAAGSSGVGGSSGGDGAASAAGTSSIGGAGGIGGNGGTFSVGGAGGFGGIGGTSGFGGTSGVGGFGGSSGFGGIGGSSGFGGTGGSFGGFGGVGGSSGFGGTGGSFGGFGGVGGSSGFGGAPPADASTSTDAA